MLNFNALTEGIWFSLIGLLGLNWLVSLDWMNLRVFGLCL